MPAPLDGDDLPRLRTRDLNVIEAAPDPAPGPARDVLAAEAAARVQRNEDVMTRAADEFTRRVAAVVLARLRGPKARKGTRYWAREGTKALAVGGEILTLEHKALDGDYIVPSKLIDEIDDAMRPVAIQVALDSAADVAARLAPPGLNVREEDMFAVDRGLLDALIDEAMEDMLGTADNYAAAVREAILDGDRAGLSLDDLLDQVEQTLDRTSRWVHLNARTTATALTGKASLEQARLLGVTHAQWISRRDGRVRPTHVLADGQVRAIGEPFRVGRHQLEYPGDPTGLPYTADEVHNCRCGLLFAPPDPRVGEALMTTARSAVGDDEGTIETVLAAANAADQFVPTPDGFEELPNLAGHIVLPVDTVGWRMLTATMDVHAGQRIALAAGTVLALAAPAIRTAATLSVVIPAGTRVGVSGGALILLDEATVEVLSASTDGLQTALF